jgi:predicted GNAT family N-acyltransferase
MALSTRSEFVDFIVPLHDRLKLYDRTKPPTQQHVNDNTDPAKAIPQGFIDAMVVREEVYVKEQGVPLENELDDEDPKSFHWTAYASIPSKHSSSGSTSPDGLTESSRRTSTSTKIPIGTIRLVPPPHRPMKSTNMYDGKEPYIKLGRLAVIKEFRKAGISKLLIDTAIIFAREHPNEISPYFDPTRVEAMRQESDHGENLEWNGLILIHAQVGIQKLWRRYGFETDEGMGVWNEEGIDHVGMWKRLDVSRARRQSKQWPHLASPLASP